MLSLTKMLKKLLVQRCPGEGNGELGNKVGRRLAFQNEMFHLNIFAHTSVCTYCCFYFQIIFKK